MRDIFVCDNHGELSYISYIYHVLIISVTLHTVLTFYRERNVFNETERYKISSILLSVVPCPNAR